MAKSSKKKEQGTPAQRAPAEKTAVARQSPSHEDGAAGRWTEVVQRKRKATPTPTTLATNQGGSTASSGSTTGQANPDENEDDSGGQANPDENEDSSSSRSASSASSKNDDSSSGEGEEDEEEDGAVVFQQTTRPKKSTTGGIPKFLQKFITSSLQQAQEKGTEPPAWVFKLIGIEDTTSQRERMEQVNPMNLAVDLAAETTSSREPGLIGAAEKNRATPARCSNNSTVSPTPGSAGITTETHPSLAESNSPLPPSTPPVRTTDTNMPVERRSLENAKFQLKQTDIPSDLKLEGLPHEDIPEKMALYRARIAILSGSVGSCNVSQETIDYRAIQNLGLFVRGAAAESPNLILASALEWRPEAHLEALRARGVRIEIAPPTTWSE